MRVVDRLCGEPPASAKLAVCIGEFDGMHVGHQAVLTELVRVATVKDLLPTAVVLGRVEDDRSPGGAPALTGREEMLVQLEQLGIEAAYLRPGAERPPKSIQATYRQVLGEESQPRVIVHGAPHVVTSRGVTVRRWGGESSATVRALGVEYGFAVLEVPRVLLALTHEPVSAPAIRDALALPDLTAARQMLGRPYRIAGVVAHGYERGRRLGFPTANIATRCQLLPSDGVFAGIAERSDGSSHGALISLGRRPTFDHDPAGRCLEVHLLDFDGMLYGERLTVAFLHWIRHQRRFPSEGALVAQIHRDADVAHSLLHSHVGGAHC